MIPFNAAARFCCYTGELEYSSSHCLHSVQRAGSAIVVSWMWRTLTWLNEVELQWLLVGLTLRLLVLNGLLLLRRWCKDFSDLRLDLVEWREGSFLGRWREWFSGLKWRLLGGYERSLFGGQRASVLKGATSVRLIVVVWLVWVSAWAVAPSLPFRLLLVCLSVLGDLLAQPVAGTTDKCNVEEAHLVWDEGWCWCL